MVAIEETRSDMPLDLGFEGSPIQKCPVCDYLLEGLPLRHRCPECGFAYDEHTRFWRPSGLIAYAGTSAICFLLTASCGYFMALGGLLAPVRQEYLMGGVFVWAILIGLDVVGFRKSPFIAITGQGLLIRDRRGRSHLIAWESVCGVKRLQVGSTVRVWLEHGKDGESIEISSMFSQDGSADCFTRQVRRYIDGRTANPLECTHLT